RAARARAGGEIGWGTSGNPFVSSRAQPASGAGEHHAHAAGADVGGDEVEQAVFVEVGGDDVVRQHGFGRRAHRDVDRRGEGAGAVAREHVDQTVTAHHGHVAVAVEIEVGADEGDGSA